MISLLVTFKIRAFNPGNAWKDAEAIKDCIRRNEHVAITLYRDFPVPLRLERGEESKVRCRNQSHGFADDPQPAAINSQPSTII
jgi:hypothetical protein